MTAGGRTIFGSVRRGLLSSLAHPQLLGVPVAIAAATVVSFVLPFGAALLLAPDGRASLAERDATRMLYALADGVDRATRSPSLLASGLVALTVVLTLLFLAAAFLRAGLYGVLIAADAQAPAAARRPHFRLPRPLRTFLVTGARFTWRVFWILNAYALALTLAFTPILVGMVLVIVGLPSGRLAPGLAVVLLGIPVAVAGGVASRLLQLAVERETVARNLTVREGIAEGLARLRATLAGSLGIFFLFAAAGIVLAMLFGLPRLVLAVALRSERALAIGATAALTLVQGLLVCALDLVTTASYVALWGEEPA